MKPFLQQVAQLFFQKHSINLSDYIFVFPNRRTGVFFQRYLAIEAGSPLLSPQITTINNLFGKLTDLKLIDRTSLLFRLYHIYADQTKSGESFDEFFYWGEMLLNDFDDIDKYMVDASKLFSSVKDLKEIEEQFAYLDESQIELISKFWSHFIPAHTSKRKESFLKTWQVLYPLYSRLKEELRRDGLAYEGMIFGDVASALKSGQVEELPFKKVVFVGLNAMTLSERVLLRALRDRDVADFYWDYQSDFLLDPDNKASFFAFDNLREFPSKMELAAPTEKRQPRIEVIGVPSAVAQAKCAHKLIEDMVEEGVISSPKHAIDTAVVLPDENLLMPMLYSVPEVIETVNVTMGYSLSNTPIAGLMKFVFDLQLMCKWEKGKAYFHHQAVIAILNHRYITSLCEEQALKLIEQIRKENLVYISSDLLRSGHVVLEKIFKPVSTPTQVSAYLKDFLEYLQGGLEDGQEDSYVVTLSELEKEFIYHYYITSNRLGDLILAHDVDCLLPTYFRILAQLTLTISIPFRGEPLSGLQLMGVLETRGLDFENQIILSVNEGVFPNKSAANSFIPYHVRKGFGMSTLEHQDAIYAYHFYRMISRAKNVYLLYDTRSAGMQTGEVSRYVHQLKYHYKWPLEEKMLTSDFRVAPAAEVSVLKTPEVMKSLEAYFKGGRKALSASAIITYLNCPLQFYFEYVEMIRKTEEISETLESSTFGTIFHAVMEKLYEPFAQKQVAESDIQQIIDDKDKLKSTITEVYKAHFKTNTLDGELDGYNSLVAEVLRQYVVGVLKEDIAQAPFLHVGSEIRLATSLTLSSGKEVSIKGFIDRVDEKDGKVQVIDYKTGQGLLTFSEIEDLFDSSRNDWAKAALQVFFYGILYKGAKNASAITPKVYFLREFFKPTVETTVKVKYNKKTNKAIEEGVLPLIPEGVILDVSPYLDTFSTLLVRVLDEIFDSEKSFCQTDNIDKCKYCSMANLCKR